MIVSRDRRERKINCFDRETISIHNIDFFDVANDVHNVEKTNNFIDFFNVITDVVNDVIDVKKTINFIEVDESEELDV